MMTGTGKSSTILDIHGALFNDILSDVKKTAHSDIPQPIVLVGVDGAGKTTLLRQIYYEVIDSGISAVWIDGRSIFSVRDITSRRDILTKTIVIIDDIDFFFGRCPYEEQYELRSFLYNEGAPMLIASAEKILPAFSEYKAPFFEGLKFVYIPPVTIDGTTASLFVTQDEKYRAEKLLSFLPKTIESVKIALNIIHDNNVYENDIPELIHRFSPQYRKTYQSLPTYSQHILLAIGNAPIPGLSLSAIKEATNLPTSVLSIYLRNLCSAGILIADKRIKKGYKYMLKDRLFGEWLSFNELRLDFSFIDSNRRY